MIDDSTDVVPLLVCADIQAEHDFLVDVLGFTSRDIERMADGSVVHAEVRAGSRRVWLHRTDEAGGLVPPARSGTSGGGIVVHVRDVDGHYDRARARGAEIIYQPRDEDYGQREYGVRDPEGHLWWIATPLEAEAASS